LAIKAGQEPEGQSSIPTVGELADEYCSKLKAEAKPETHKDGKKILEKWLQFVGDK